MSAPVFELRDVAKTYDRARSPVPVFENLNFEVEDGAFIALMGPSGSGKTTLLNLLGGIDRPSSGQILFKGERIDALGQRDLTRWRARNVGFVFQNYNLLPMLSAQRNVELPLYLTALPASERETRSMTALDLVGLSDCARRPPTELSGGQQQRVAIARALVADTTVLLCDEPTGNLDRTASQEVLEILSLLNKQLGKTVVIVTHDRKAADYAGTIYNLDKGQFVSEPVAD